jgi:hypothetical protein
VDPVPDTLLLRESGSVGSRTRTSDSAARNFDHRSTTANVHCSFTKVIRVASQMNQSSLFSLTVLTDLPATPISVGYSKTLSFPTLYSQGAGTERISQQVTSMWSRFHSGICLLRLSRCSRSPDRDSNRPPSSTSLELSLFLHQLVPFSYIHSPCLYLLLLF